MNDQPLRGIFTALARHARDHSDDPSTQNAAFVPMPPAGTLPFLAANQVPWALTLPEAARLSTDREWKLQVMEHAERAVLYQTVQYGQVQPPEVMYALWAACADCARAIVAAGIRTLYRLDLPHVERWAASIAAGDAVMNRGCVKVITVPMFDPPLGVSIRFDGKELPL